MKRRYTRSQRQQLKKFRTLGVLIFAAVMAIGAFIGLLFFVRPKKSTMEKRTLAKFPSFTITSFLDGSYFEDVSLWYSDTYPMRDKLVSADQSLKKLYGIQLGTQVVGGNAKGDEIPEVDKSAVTATPDDAGKATTESTTEVTTEDPEIGLPASLTSKNKQDATTESGSVQTVDPPDSKAMDNAFQKQLQDNLYVKDGSAYSLYYFVQDSATEYIDAINNAAAQLSGQTNVYDILVPNNSGVLLSDDELDKLGGSDQKQAIEYYYGMMNGVKTVDIFDTLKAHKDEYIFFRTDHHWTADGSEQKWNVIMDVNGWDKGTMYSTFVGGDTPMAVIENPNVTDGSSCVVMKESYGNAFIPFLVDHYSKIYIIDYRYSQVNILDFVKSKKVNDFICINNISLIGDKDVAATISSLLH